MDARQRWQALQARLTAARAAVDAGDRATALAEISAALELDKDFLAAQALRDRIISGTAGSPHRPAASRASIPPESVPPPAAPPPIPSEPIAAAPISGSNAKVWTENYARFEQRARRRRVDRRVDAARAAIAQRRVKAAAAALDEVIELDPNLPELAELTAQFDALRRAAATPRRGPWLAAAAVFAGALLGGSWLHDSVQNAGHDSAHDPAPLGSRQMVAAAELPAPMRPLPLILASDNRAIDAPEVEVGTTGTRDIVRAATPGIAPAAVVFAPIAAPPPAAVPAVPAPRMPDAVTAMSPPPLRLPPAVDDAPPVPVPGPGPRVAEPAAAVTNATAAPAVSKAVPPRIGTPEDEGLIKQVLQRYRQAYEGLDAQSAQAVWPAVNEAALARAFDGLQSQSLTFDGCDVRLRGEAASATCHGSARYVTKVGSRDPRTEPRVWNFTLRKAGSEWMIDSARAER